MFYNPRRGKMAHLHEKVGGFSHSSCPFTCLMVDHATAQIEVVRKSLIICSDKLQRYLHKNIYASGPVKTAIDFNMNVYGFAVYL